MDGLQLKLLGPLEVWRDGVLVPVPAARQRDLLAALALRAGRVVTTERLVTILWGEEPPATARNTLQTLVRRLRRLLALDELQTRPAGYLLAIEPDQVDAYRFETLLRTGREALAGGDPAAAVRLLDSALGLWRGSALADLTSDELLLVEQPRLTELRQQAVEDRIEARLSAGESGAGLVAELRALVTEQPLRERPYEQLMTALYRAGRRAEALATYRALRETLTEQLGVEPGETANRLHQAMLRGDPALARPAEPVAAPAEPAPAPAQLPAEVAGFVGRADELATLDRHADTRLLAVVGTAGVGKTALVLRWAHRLRERFPDGQLHVDLCGFSAIPALRPVDVLARFLRDLGVPSAQVPADPAEAAARYRTLLADRRVLVVLDNARDAEQVRPLLPGGPACLAVVTSRDRLDSLVAYEGAARLRLAPLPAGESRDLLAQALGPGPVADEPAAAGELAKLCAHLPLALRIAAASLAGRGASLASYVARLRRHGLEGLALVDNPQAAVRTTFDLSYAALAGDAKRLFRLLGCLPGVDLTGESAAALADVDRAAADRLLDRLTAAHLLSEEAGRFGCHDLLHDYAVRLAQAMPPAERAAAARRLIGWYVAAAESAADLLRPDRLRLPGVAEADSSRWERADQAVAWLDAERHNLALVAQHAAEFGMPAAAWRLASCLPSSLVQRGHLPELLVVSRAALSAAETAGDPAGQAVARLAIGTIHFVRQHHELAVEQYRRAEELARAAGWQEGRSVALHSLGNAYQGAGRRAEAAQSYAHALELQERLGLVQGRAATLTNIGNTRWELGELDEAVEYYRQAVALYRAAGGRTWQMGIVLGNTGSVLLELGRLDEALAHLTEAVSIQQELGNRVSEALSLHMLAAVHRDAGRLPQAAELAESALRLAREIGHRLAEAFALSTVATIHHAGGGHQAALIAGREALGLAVRLGHTHLAAHVQLELAATCRALGEYDLASSHAAQALTIARENDYRLVARRAHAALAAGAVRAVSTDAPASVVARGRRPVRS